MRQFAALADLGAGDLRRADKGETREDMLAGLERVGIEENEVRAAALLGVTYLECGELNLARRQFETAIQLNPDYAEAYAYLGYIQGQLGEYEAGWDNLVEAVTLEPDSVLAHYFLGVYYRSLGMGKAARTRFWRAVNLDSNNAPLCVNLAQAYLAEASVPAKWTPTITTARTKRVAYGWVRRDNIRSSGHPSTSSGRCLTTGTGGSCTAPSAAHTSRNTCCLLARHDIRPSKDSTG